MIIYAPSWDNNINNVFYKVGACGASTNKEIVMTDVHQRVGKLARILCLLILLALPLAACGGEESTSSTPSEQAGGQSGSTLPSDPKAAVVQVLTAMQNSGPYRVTTTIVSDDTTMEMTGEVIPPDKMHNKTMIDDQPMEMLMVGEQSWMKLGDDWQEMPGGAALTIEQALGFSVDELDKMITDVAYVGVESLNSVDAAVYTFTNDTSKSEALKDMDVKSTVKLWVNIASGLPIQQEIAGEAMGIKSTSTQMIEFDDSITIEPPVQ